MFHCIIACTFDDFWMFFCWAESFSKLRSYTKESRSCKTPGTPIAGGRERYELEYLDLFGSTNWNQQGPKFCSIFCDSGAGKKNMETAAKICWVVFQWKMDVDELIIVFTREFDQNGWIHNTWSPFAFSVAHQLCIGKEWLQSVRRHSTLPPFAASGPKKEKKEQISQSWKWHNIFVLLLSMQWIIVGRSFRCDVILAHAMAGVSCWSSTW